MNLDSNKVLKGRARPAIRASPGDPLFAQPVEGCHDCPVVCLSKQKCPFVVRKVEAGTVVCAQGQRPDHVSFIKEGYVALTSVGPDGVEARLSIRGPRSLVAVEALRGHPSPWEVRALSDTTLCGLPRDAAEQWLGPAGSPARALFELVLDEQLRTHEVEDLRRSTCLQRVARLVLRHSQLFAAGRCRSLTHDVAARMLGMRAETFSRCVTQLAKQGLIQARSFQIINAHGLAEVAGEVSD